jgi:hypothetical protein
MSNTSEDILAQNSERSDERPAIFDANRLPTSVATVHNIPPDERIYSLGRLAGSIHIYNTGRPVGGDTTYDVTIVNVNHYLRQLAPGHTDTYNAGTGNAMYIQNHGPSALQVLSMRQPQGTAQRQANPFMQSLVSQGAGLYVDSASPGKDVMSTLQRQWYNTVVSGLGLDPKTFQLFQASAPLSFTSKALWSIFNSIPPDSLTQVFSQSQFNNFYADYHSVIMTILPPDGSQFRQAMGDDLTTWETYQKTLKPGTDVLTAFKEWAQLNLEPGRATKVSVLFAQLLNGTVGRAVENVLDPKFVDANNGPIFSKTIQNLNDELKSAPSRSFSFDSSTASSDISHTWASGSVGGFYGFFSGGGQGNFDQLNKKAASSQVTIQASFKRVLSFAAAPGGWYSSAALKIAYSTSDNTVWPVGQHPDWSATFGPDGNLQRLATELIVVDGTDVTITSEASYSESEQKQISTSTSLGFWPFFSASGSGSSKTTIAFDSSGKMTVRISMPLGNPNILGVNVLPIKAALGG